MDIRLSIAMSRRDTLQAIEEKLKAIGVDRIDVSMVTGYGNIATFFRS